MEKFKYFSRITFTIMFNKIVDKSSIVNQINSSQFNQMIHIDIPICNGNYLEWESLKDLFTNLVNKYEKLLIFNIKVKGEALLLISAYVKSSQYTQAWVILWKKYNNSNLPLSLTIQI